MAKQTFSAMKLRDEWQGDGPCPFYCTLCGGRVVDDPPESTWISLGQMGGHTMIDGHDRCHTIYEALTKAGGKAAFQDYLRAVGIPAEDQAKARDVLMHVLRHRQV